MDIINRVELWAEKTYGECIDNREYIFDEKCDKKQYDKYKRILKSMKLYDKRMTGSTVMGHSGIDSGNIGKTFSEIFNDTIIEHDGNICDYILSIIDCCSLKGFSDDIIEKWIGRGLKAFPSFLREKHFMDLLDEEISEIGIKHEIITSVELDVQNHTDIKLKVFIENEEYDLYFWLYQCSRTGIIKTREKILGKHGGEVKNGFNILCPINIQREDDMKTCVKDWYFYTKKYVSSIIDELGNENNSIEYYELCDILEKEIKDNILYEESLISKISIIDK